MREQNDAIGMKRVNFNAAIPYIVIFTFSKQAFHEFLDFSNLHSLMNDKNLIDSCQANLPVQYALNIEFIRQK